MSFLNCLVKSIGCMHGYLLLMLLKNMVICNDFESSSTELRLFRRIILSPFSFSACLLPWREREKKEIYSRLDNFKCTQNLNSFK